MKYILTFNENLSIYNPEWKQFLPDEILVIKGQFDGIQKIIFKKGNIMLNADMVQISYYQEDWGAPDTFEIDIYFVSDSSNEISNDSTTVVKVDGSLDYESYNKMNQYMRLDCDITFGDEMACEFSIDSRNGVKCYQDTTYGSKFDPSNTIFAIEDKSLQQLVDFFNRFNLDNPEREKTDKNLGNLTITDFNFLRDV